MTAGLVKGLEAGGTAGKAITGALGKAGKWAQRIAHTAAHGLVNGVRNVVMGGKFKDGFLSAAAAAYLSHYTPVGNGFGAFEDLGSTSSQLHDVVGRTAMAAIVGGTVSRIGGGDFANGAYTAAFQHLFNAEGVQKIREKLLVLRRRYTIDMTGSKLSAREIISAFIKSPSKFTKTKWPWLKTDFKGSFVTGGKVQIDGPGRVNPWMHVVNADANLGSVTLATMTGHPEAGYINFSAYQSGDITTFSITSIASARNPIIEKGFTVLGQHVQKSIWTNVLNNVSNISGSSGGNITYHTSVQGDGQ